MNVRLIAGVILALLLGVGGILMYVTSSTGESSGLAAIATSPESSLDGEPLPPRPPADSAAGDPAPPSPPVRAPAAPVSGEPAVAAAPLVRGELRIASDVEGAQVFLDRQFVGTTPLVVADVSIGGHQLTVAAEGFEMFADLLDVEPGPIDVNVEFRAVRLDTAIDVVHRHRLGSCEGMLLATPSGITYETDNANDGFSVPLASLEAFEVDYQATNLRVRTVGGRDYNFTDPGGNADPLFVFHREVQQARERLEGEAQ